MLKSVSIIKLKLKYNNYNIVIIGISVVSDNTTINKSRAGLILLSAISTFVLPHNDLHFNVACAKYNVLGIIIIAKNDT